MPTPRILIVRAPGTNCDAETAFAFERAGATCENWHSNRLLKSPEGTRDFQVLCFPGGFSFGDDIAAGRIQANQMRHHLGDTLRRFRDDGKLILGICNGFQVLIRTGVLWANDEEGEPATLTWNESGRYQDRWVHVTACGDRCVFLRGIERLYLPIAHAEGRFVPRNEAVLERLDRAGQLPLRYAAAESTMVAASSVPGTAIVGDARQGRGSRNGSADRMLPFPLNPNGSIANVAGICDETGQVFGLMPHPERHIDRTHHPRWTRGEGSDPGEGLQVFRNAVDYFAN